MAGIPLGRDNSINNIFEITHRRLKEDGSSELVTGGPLEENCSGGRRRALLAEEEGETFPCTTRRETKESNFVADAFYTFGCAARRPKRTSRRDFQRE